jgi:ATP-dependent DNA helicase RecG
VPDQGAMSYADVQKWVSSGESATLEFKQSTGQLSRAGETLCAFLNGDGGAVVLGVTLEGRVVGQEVGDKTRGEIAAVLDRFEPPALVEVEYVDLPGSDRKLVVLEARLQGDARPFVFDGRPYQRVGTTTSRMPQERYESLLLDRMQARWRWENQPAVGVRVEDLDAEEILRTREDAVRHRRISAGTSMDVGDVLDRLGLRIDGVVTQAAQVLYGTRFLPDYPQARLKLGRFRGTKITGDVLDNTQEYLHAFAMVREAMAFLDRTLPLSGHFVEGRIQREDRLPVPPAALREILLNAVMHRDYTDPGGDVAVAVFDDRVEIRSRGTLPSGVTAAMLSGPHESILRNPRIAGAFHRTGAVEVGGRGTDRVVEECKRWGVEPPRFEVVTGALCVTFPAATGPGVEARHQVGTKSALSGHQVQVLEAATVPQSIAHFLQLCGRSDRTKFRDQVVRPLLEAGLLEMTVPSKPRSSRQRYRTTEAGKQALSEE